MSTRYPGGFINRSAPVIVGPTDGEGGSAPGVWTLEQASYYTKQGTWPQRIKDRPLYSWGWNGAGELGLNDRSPRSSPTQVGASVTWLTAYAGTYCSFAKKSDGALWSWGNNPYGQLGQGNTVSRSSPVQIGSLTNWSTVSGKEHIHAIKTDGTLWSWGYVLYGALGDNTLTNKSSPVQIGSLTTWSKISTGWWHSLAIKTDGTLWSWGYNAQGSIGDGTTINRSSPVQVGALTTWLNAGGGNYHSAATKTDGTLWSWGRNNYGQLGQNIDTAIKRSSPVQVGALTTWLNVVCGAYNTLALKTDGTIWSWGYNNAGQVGDGTTINRSSPVQIGSLSNWSFINSSALGSRCFIANSSGQIFAFGENGAGSLGTGNTVNYSSPVQVSLSTSWSSFSSGPAQTLFIPKI